MARLEEFRHLILGPPSTTPRVGRDRCVLWIVAPAAATILKRAGLGGMVDEHVHAAEDAAAGR
jgi:hypothetical protein